MRKKAFVLSLTAALFFLIVTLLASGDPGYQQAGISPGPTWFYEDVDVPGFYFGLGDRGLRVDAAGVPHVVYGGSHLYLARYQEGAWVSEVVDGNAGVGEGASLALDSNGRSHVAYKDNFNRKVKYAHWNGSSWDIQSLAGIIDYNLLGLAIDVDTANRPHIVYLGDDGINRGLHYAHWNGGAWTIEEVLEVTGLEAAAPSIAMDSAGQPHVSFADLSNNVARYARRQAGSWVLEDVGPIGFDLGTSIALDSTDRPHMAYLATDGDDNTGLMYAVRTSGVWTPSKVADAGPNVGVSLVLNEYDQPAIANDGSIFSYDGAIWTEAPIPDLSGNFHLSIALNQAGRPCVCALRNYRSLQCAQHDGDDWTVDEFATIPDGSSAGRGNALAVSSSHQLRATYIDEQTNSLAYAIRQEDGWHTSVISNVLGDFPTDLALDGSDDPHVCIGRFSWLDYAFLDAAGWSVEPVDDGFGDHCTLALDSAGRPHVAYLAHGEVRYAFRTDSGWQFAAPDAYYDVTVDLALDQAERPHLVYFDGSGHPDYEHYLRHAVLNGSAWMTDTIDQGGWVSAAAIAIDEYDNPHVAYYHKHGNVAELRYATEGGGLWQMEVVAEGMYYGQEIEIVLDDSGRPHLLFWDDIAYLHYASRTDQGWQMASVASSRIYDNDMALDGRVVHISFKHYDLGLLLASSRPFGLEASGYIPIILSP